MKLAGPRFGIEEELFAFCRGRVPEVAELDALMLDLVRTGYTVAAHATMQGDMLAAQRDFAAGPVTIKHEFCTHILEVAYPPCQDPTEFSALHARVHEALLRAFDRHRFTRRPGAVLPERPAGTLVCELASLSDRVDRLLSRPVPNAPWSERYFLAVMCAAQVHFDIDHSNLFSHLDALYSFEFLFPLLFSNGQEFRGRRAFCARPLIYRDSFTRDHHAVCIPHPIPRSEAAHECLVRAIPQRLRDYVLIRPRRGGTAEFRSACAQPSSDRLLEMVALRFAVLAAVEDGPSAEGPDREALFYSVCRDGVGPGEVIRAVVDRLAAQSPRIPAPFRAYLSVVLARLRAVTG